MNIGGEGAARRGIHEGHELVGKARHGAADADPAHVGAAADPVHPAALGDVAVDHRTPAADLDLALRGVVVLGEIPLLVVAAAIAPLVHGLAEQPGGAQLVVQGDHGIDAGHLVQQPEQRLREVVRLDRAARHVDDGDARGAAEVPPQVVGKPHAAGRIAGHGVDAAVGGAGAGRHHRQRLRRQPVDPRVQRDRLPRLMVVAEGGEVPLGVDLFVGDGTLHHEDVRPEFASGGGMEGCHEVVAGLLGRGPCCAGAPWEARAPARARSARWTAGLPRSPKPSRHRSSSPPRSTGYGPHQRRSSSCAP